MSETVLWDYPKSSASYRLRIALNLAGLEYRLETVDLLTGAHRSDAHLARNPQGFVPVLDIDGHRFTQSLAILDYLDATRDMGLLPSEPADRAKVTALAHCIAVDLHPVCNLSVMRHATGGEEPVRTEWMRHFIRPGLEAFEVLLAGFEQTPFATGSTPNLADICLIPQLYNANRWGVEYSDLSRITAIEKACAAHDAFKAAHPDMV
ncbi:maleylacetoacetate isomerase [Planktotalea frisia]|uniref:Maleylpyruvate isomerase n=1 Tax=Planktotalea frisia TaxID=696762 RepID=A0A1L9NSN9_9RHOB|nr:maleylacetoacetate isomerase [Planktotalea frisia]OJI92330.1 maleylpyruvate isomerase [Planktotalea frisia]PZX33294.1 maleylacetoacetate isomerase [Planktotalea frisia]